MNTPIRTTVARRVTVAIAVLATAAVVQVGGAATAAASGFTVQLVPPTAGVEVLFRGQEYTSDEFGRVVLPTSSEDDVQRHVSLPDQEVGHGLRVTQGKWYQGRASAGLRLTIDKYRLVTLAYLDRNGAPLDPTGVDQLTSITLRGSTGATQTFEAADLSAPHWLQESRVAPIQDRLSERPILWTVQEAVVRGTNVVNRSEQQFTPLEDVDGLWNIVLLFYPATISVRDAVFGFPVGSALRITFPDGSVETHELGSGATVRLPALPRGEYGVSVDGPGVTLSAPVALSRPQDVTVTFISYYDVAAGILGAVAFVVGLPLIGWAWRRRRTGAGAKEAADAA